MAPAFPTPPLPVQGHIQPALLPRVTKGRWSPFHLLRCSLRCGSSRFVLGRPRWGPCPRPVDGPQPRGQRYTQNMAHRPELPSPLSWTSGPGRYLYKGTDLQSSRIPAWRSPGPRGLGQILSLSVQLAGLTCRKPLHCVRFLQPWPPTISRADSGGATFPWGAVTPAPQG